MRYRNLAFYLNGQVVHTHPPGDEVTAFAPAIIEWGSENGLTQPDPATLEITIETPTGEQWPTLGDVVALTGETGTNQTRLNLFDGVVSHAARYPGHRDRLRLHCDDWRAVAARRYIGAPPWPQHTIADRLRAILGQAPEIPYHAGRLSHPALTAQVAQRDINNQPVMRLLEETLSGIDWIITSTPNGLDFIPRPTAGAQTLEVNPGQDDAALVLDTADTRAVACHAGAVIDDVPRILDLDNLMNHVALAYPVEPDWEAEPDRNPNANWDDQTQTWENLASITRYGEAAFTTRTDVLEPTPRREALSRAMHLTPAWQLATYQIDPRSTHWPVGNFAATIGEETTRELAAIVFPHSADITITAGRITRGRLTLGGTSLEALELELEPWNIASGIGLRFDMFRSFDQFTVLFNSPYLTTFDKTEGGFSDYHNQRLPDPRFNEMGKLTFDDMATANTVTWKGINQ